MRYDKTAIATRSFLKRNNLSKVILMQIKKTIAVNFFAPWLERTWF